MLEIHRDLQTQNRRQSQRARLGGPRTAELLRALIGQPDAILLVEFAGDDRSALLARLQRLVQLMISACEGKRAIPEQVLIPAALYISENL